MNFIGCYKDSRAYFRVGPLYHGVLSDLAKILSPFLEDTGIKQTDVDLYLVWLRNGDSYI